MTCRTYTKKETVMHAVYIAFLTLIGATAVYSSVFALSGIACREDAISAGITVFCALLVIGVDFFECRAMGARLYMNEEGIGVRRFGKTKVFLRWGDIKAVTVGRIPAPFGSKERICFCDRELSEKEKTDMVTLKYHTVHFSRIPGEWADEIRRHLPLLVTQEMEKYVR